MDSANFPKDESDQEKQKLKKKDILKFYSILKTAAISDQPGQLKMLSQAYFDYLHSILNSQRGHEVNQAMLIQQIEILKAAGFFGKSPNKLDATLIDLIVQDIQSGGALLKASMATSTDKHAAEAFIQKLDTENSKLSHKPSRKMTKRQAALEKELMENLLIEDNTDYRRSSLRFLVTHELKNGKEAFKKCHFDEAITCCHKSIQALNDIYSNMSKQISAEQALQIREKDENLADIQRQLAKAHHDLAMTVWNNTKDPEMDNVILNLETAINTLEEISPKMRSDEDDEWLRTYRGHLDKVQNLRITQEKEPFKPIYQANYTTGMPNLRPNSRRLEPTRGPESQTNPKAEESAKTSKISPRLNDLGFTQFSKGNKMDAEKKSSKDDRNTPGAGLKK